MLLLSSVEETNVVGTLPFATSNCEVGRKPEPRTSSEKVVPGAACVTDPEDRTGNTFSTLTLSEEEATVEANQHAIDVARKLINAQERNEHEALEEGVADLIRLDRYERSAWSRQKRAIRNFMNIRLNARLNRGEATL